MASLSTTPYIGRFAPSPTGDLHFGSLLAAVASYLQAKTSGGKWLLRIEDIDSPREVAGSAQSIIEELSRFGLTSDEPVLFQSSRGLAYQQACDRLVDSGQAYWCGCTRKDRTSAGIYPGTCRNGLAHGRKPRALRLRVPDQPIQLHDELQGTRVEYLPQTSGDFVIRRADGIFAYQLAVVVDDAYQGVTEIVRGADLLDCTARQIWLQQCLGLFTPRYFHIPIAIDSTGEKLSKSAGSTSLRLHAPVEMLRKALSFLGHDVPHVDVDLDTTWSWALDNWSISRVPGERQAAFGSDQG